MTDRLKDIQGNWEYERCIKPEDVDYLLERVEELEEENRKLNMEIGRYAGQVFEIKQTLGANIAELGILTVKMFGGKDDE